MKYHWRLILITIALVSVLNGQAKIVGSDNGSYTADRTSSADVIVIGRILQSKLTTGWNIIYGSATVKVEETLATDIPIGETLPLRWLTSIDYLDHNFNTHKTGSQIFFLVRNQDNKSYNPFGYGSDISNKAEIQKLLKSPVALRQVTGSSINAYTLKVVYRNCTTGTMQISVLENRGNRLIAPEGAELLVSSNCIDFETTAPSDITPLPGAWVTTTSPKMATLMQGQQHEVVFPFHEIFPKLTNATDTYNVRYRQPNMRLTNRVLLFSNDPEQDHLNEMKATYDAPPLYKLMVYMMYSPTRECIAGGVLLAISLVTFALTRRKKVIVE